MSKPEFQVVAPAIENTSEPDTFTPTDQRLDEDEMTLRALRLDLPGTGGAPTGIVSIAVSDRFPRREFFRTHPTHTAVLPMVDHAAGMDVAEGQAEYGPCQTCGRMNRISTPGPLFCNGRCRDYVPLRPRKPDGDWFIVAGPVDYCAACATAVTPRKPHGDLTPHRKYGRLYCGCAQKRQKAGAALRVQS
jgi:hypothetical protein